MNTDAKATLTDYIKNPTGFLRLGKIRIGRVEFRDIELTGHQSANQLQELMETACEKTRRVRVSKNGTRYPTQLPIAAPARKLSIEIADYLADMRR